MALPDRSSFWRHLLGIQETIVPHVIQRVLIFGLIAGIICLISAWAEARFETQLKLEVAPYEIAGGVLGLLLVLRTNAGYDRWWDARKLWGSIINQSRNLIISSMSYGPREGSWLNEMTRWTVLFAYVAKWNLEQKSPCVRTIELLTPQELDAMLASGHPPSFISLQIGKCLQEATNRGELDSFAFIQLDRERASLIDHLGGCERILKTPLPVIYSITIRRFITLFVLMMPLAFLHRLDSDWVVPIITMIFAYPLLAIDQIGLELQNPFSVRNPYALPLQSFCETIEGNLKGLIGLANEGKQG